MLLACALALPGSADPTQENASALAVLGLTFTATGSEEADFTLWADRGYMDGRAKQIWLEQVNLTVHADGDRPAVKLRCSEGYFEVDSEAFRLMGDVRGHMGSGRRFWADWVAYDDERGILYSDAPVLFEEKESAYRGGGFRYNVAEDRLELVHGVQVLRE